MPELQPARPDRLFSLKSITDERGTLVAVENGPALPFTIQRLFYVVGAGDAPRGMHAHREQHEFIMCAAGSCLVTTDDGIARRDYELCSPDRGLYLAPMEWIELRSFSKDCVLLALASAPYDESDYIRDYNIFIAEASGTRPS